MIVGVPEPCLSPQPGFVIWQFFKGNSFVYQIVYITIKVLDFKIYPYSLAGLYSSTLCNDKVESPSLHSNLA